MPPGIQFLDQVIKHIEVNELPPCTLIRQVHVDGEPVVSQATDGNGNQFPSWISVREKVEIFTGTVAEVAGEATQEALFYLDRVEAITPSLASSFQVSPGPEAFEQLKQLYQGFYWLNLLSQRVGAITGFDPETRFLPETTASEYHRKFVSILKRLVEAQETEDFSLISGLLEYEILPLIPDWKALFRTLNECASRLA